MSEFRPVLAGLAWLDAAGASREGVERFLEDVALLCSAGSHRDVLAYAYRASNTSLLAGRDGGPWLAFLHEYGHWLAARALLAEAEALVGRERQT